MIRVIFLLKKEWGRGIFVGNIKVKQEKWSLKGYIYVCIAMFEFDSKDSRRREKSCEGLSLLKGEKRGY